MTEAAENAETIIVRRHWNDYRQATVKLSHFRRPHWDYVSGGVNAPSPHPMVYGYIMCDQIVDGELAHSCSHGSAPHDIKVVMVAKDNPKALVKRMRAEADAERSKRQER